MNCLGLLKINPWGGKCLVQSRVPCLSSCLFLFLLAFFFIQLETDACQSGPRAERLEAWQAALIEVERQLATHNQTLEYREVRRLAF
jgi:hypothetical protein